MIPSALSDPEADHTQSTAPDTNFAQPVSHTDSILAVYDGLPGLPDSLHSPPIATGSGGPIKTRMSFDSNTESSSMTAAELDNGLRRIRQAPSRRPSAHATQPPNIGTVLSPSVSAPYRSTSNPLSSPSDLVSPPSPLMVLSEDLNRFPQESLHSFSFAHQTDESLRNRQNVLRRSIDFMKDKLSRIESHPQSSSLHHARLSGDDEVQSVMDMMQKANIMRQTSPRVQPSDTQSPFNDPHEPDRPKPLTLAVSEGCASPDQLSPDQLSPTSGGQRPLLHDLTRAQTADSQADLSLPARRSQMKRTYTDLDSFKLQNKLSDMLSSSLHGFDRAAVQQALVSPTSATSAAASDDRSLYRRHINNNSNGHPLSHGTRQHAAAQAIFTTDTSSPWNVTAANDLACLVFGVSMAEVRKMGIMEIICPERRPWLEGKLSKPNGKITRNTSINSSPERDQSQTQNGNPSTSPRLGTGVTAKLLNKPPVRDAYQSRRPPALSQARLDSAKAPPAASAIARANSVTRPSRGVLLCGDVVPIQKRNGSVGSASLWVKEKQGGFIWVLEEIAKDSAAITVDEVGCIIKGSGSIEAIFGMERVRRGMDIKKLLPQLPKQPGTFTGALDYDKIAEVRRYTARTSNSINIPVTVDLVSDELTIKVSSFPHIAGIMVLSSDTLRIISSNSVFSAALFGYENPDGFHINNLIPHFDTLLGVISDEDSTELVDGIVIPEHSFRRARSLLAIRQGHADAASIFLRPSGLPAKHRDGSEIMIDLQMRVLTSDAPTSDTGVWSTDDVNRAKVSYALWITYSRQLHAVNHGIGPVSPLAMSRPGTPPRQPVPSQRPTPVPEETGESPAEERVNPFSPTDGPLASGSPYDYELFEHPTPAAQAAGAMVTPKKAITDFAILEEMGKGAYGEVKLVRYTRASAQKMVVKYVTKRRILMDTWTRDRKLGTVPLEIHVLDYLRRDGLQHRNIVEMADFFEDDVNYYIEMIPHGLPGVDLFDYIELRVNMEERECRQIFVQVASALHHLHNKARVVHRDIKDENVILDGQGAVKVVDFGSAAYIKSGPFDVFVGTIDYAAPEVLRGLPYRGKEQDVWALGILLYTIVYKENPFYSIDEIMDHDLRVPYVMSEDCLDLIRRMLDRDVERRIGIQDVLEHTWCTSVEPGGGGGGASEVSADKGGT